MILTNEEFEALRESMKDCLEGHWTQATVNLRFDELKRVAEQREEVKRESSRYNGWTNAETWYAAQVVEDLGPWDELARECRRDAVESLAHFGVTVEHPGISTLSDALKSQVEEFIDGASEGGSEVGKTFTQYAIDSVSWWEIAENILNDLPADEDENNDEDN